MNDNEMTFSEFANTLTDKQKVEELNRQVALLKARIKELTNER